MLSPRDDLFLRMPELRQNAGVSTPSSFVGGQCSGRRRRADDMTPSSSSRTPSLPSSSSSSSSSRRSVTAAVSLLILGFAAVLLSSARDRAELGRFSGALVVSLARDINVGAAPIATIRSGRWKEATVSFQRWLAEAAERGKLLRDSYDGAVATAEKEQGKDLDVLRIKIVHTFFSPIDPATRLPTDKLNVTDRVMLDTWRAAWESQGWKTKILTIEDAKKHPDFDHYNKSLDAVPLGWNNYYNRLCYLRWLAMAAAGGGFMSDYDTVPIRHPPSSWSDIPDRFTVYGSGVPSLVSGTKAEWDRMARLLLETALAKTKADPDRHLWSDMMMLQELNEVHDKHYVMRHETLGGAEALSRLPLKPEDCEYFSSDGRKRIGGYRLVHFSHHDLEEAFKAGRIKDVGGGTWEKEWEVVLSTHRSKAMNRFMDQWNLVCNAGGSEVEVKVT